MQPMYMVGLQGKETRQKKRFRLKPHPHKLLARLLVLLVVVYAAFAGLVLWSMRQPPEQFGKVMAKMPGPVPFLLFPFETAWTHARAGSLQTGDPAPEFSLLKVDKSERIDLAGLNRTQPVVLVFGSYT